MKDTPTLGFLFPGTKTIAAATDKIAMDDEQLVAAIARGDDTALRELFNRHAPWLAARLRRALPPDAVEDTLQETFIAVWRGAMSYRAGGSVGAWLWGIGRRQAALWLRKQRRLSPNSEAPMSGPTTASHASEVEWRVDVQQALAALGADADEQRDLVRLVYVEDRSLAEVASMLGIPQGTVKSRLFKVRNRLRTALQGGE